MNLSGSWVVPPRRLFASVYCCYILIASTRNCNSFAILPNFLKSSSPERNNHGQLLYRTTFGTTSCCERLWVRIRQSTTTTTTRLSTTKLFLDTRIEDPPGRDSQPTMMETQNETVPSSSSVSFPNNTEPLLELPEFSVSRRNWLIGSASAVSILYYATNTDHPVPPPSQTMRHQGGTIVVASPSSHSSPTSTAKPPGAAPTGTSKPPPEKASFAPVNLTQVVKETRVNITMECRTTCVSLDTNTFQKKQTIKLPSWVPSSLVPPPKVIKDIPNSEVLAAAIVAGSTMEIGRTTLLYPLLTLKTRTQTDIRTTGLRKMTLRKRLKLVGLTAAKHWNEGNLYAGILPAILITVPATGVYYGVRDVFKRMLAPLQEVTGGGLYLALAAAFAADVVMLAFRTPADALTIRLQVSSGQISSQEEEEGRGDAVAGDASEYIRVKGWFVESLERLPAVILTDLPYLLSRTALNRIFIHGDVGIGYYEFTAIATGILCAFLTTPFDVARTRILIDSDNDPDNGIDGGSGEDLIKTFQTIYNEGDGGINNLFAGWFERTLYLGIGRACVEPLMLVGYIALRDYILLDWFD